MLLEEVLLSASGRPMLREGEVQCAMHERADLEPVGTDVSVDCSKEKRVDGCLILTTVRILWIDKRDLPDRGQSCAIPLDCVVGVDPPRWHPWKTPRMRLRLALDAAGRLTSQEANLSSTAYLDIPLRSKKEKHLDMFYSIVDNLKRKTWSDCASSCRDSETHGSWQGRSPSDQRVPQASSPHTAQKTRGQHQGRTSGSEGKGEGTAFDRDAEASNRGLPAFSRFSTQNAGVAGIIQRELKSHQKTDGSLERALSDMSALMEDAKEMVIIAGRLRDKVNSSPSELSKEREEMSEMLLSLGMDTPITKDNAGSLYHQQVACQISDFLIPLLKKSNGMIPLVDTYCVYNRARGTDLISPNDLLCAASLFSPLRLPLKLRQFSSGLMVIESKWHAEDALCKDVMKLLETRQYLTAKDVSVALTVPVILAQEYLQTIENRGNFCRDDTLEGLRFYQNIFSEKLVKRFRSSAQVSV